MWLPPVTVTLVCASLCLLFGVSSSHSQEQNGNNASTNTEEPLFVGPQSDQDLVEEIPGSRENNSGGDSLNSRSDFLTATTLSPSILLSSRNSTSANKPSRLMPTIVLISQPTSSLPRPQRPVSTKTNSMNDYVAIGECILLVVSNFFLLPAIYLAVKGQYRGEAFVYGITMVSSSFYHMCDNEKLQYCIVPFGILQFLDFYSAILALWCTAIVLANVPFRWISSFHLVGAIFFAGLLKSSVVGVWSFVVPGFCSLLVLGCFWGHLYYTERRLPDIIYSPFFYIAVGLIVFGSIMFASQTSSLFRSLYGVTHSLWHICMGLAITFLLPRYQKLFYWDHHYKIDPKQATTECGMGGTGSTGKSLNSIKVPMEANINRSSSPSKKGIFSTTSITVTPTTTSTGHVPTAPTPNIRSSQSAIGNNLHSHPTSNHSTSNNLSKNIANAHHNSSLCQKRTTTDTNNILTLN